MTVNGQAVETVECRNMRVCTRIFATLVRGRAIDVDPAPLQLAADAFLWVDARRSSRSSSDARALIRSIDGVRAVWMRASDFLETIAPHFESKSRLPGSDAVEPWRIGRLVIFFPRQNFGSRSSAAKVPAASWNPIP